MNKKQIKAELRRSACEDEKPFWTMESNAFSMALRHRDRYRENILYLRKDDLRTFILFVAEAIE